MRPERTKPLGSLSGLFIGLTAVVSVWLFYEVGLLKFATVAASDTVEKKADPGWEALQRSVQEREKTLAEKEQTIGKRELAVADREKALEEQIASYQKTIQELRDRLAANETKSDDRPDAFLSIYEKMEAKRAAKIFEKLDLPLAARLLKRMSSIRAAEILGLMPPEKAKVITERHQRFSDHK